jgi:hypothetical protein
MIDDEVLDVMRKTLSDVRMDRPVEAIEQRGRALRRNRALLGVVAGGGLAAVVAVALALALVSHQSGTAPAESGPVVGGSTAGGAPAMEQAAFTVVKQTDGSVELTLAYVKILNPEALQKALTDAGIPAVVKVDVLCTPKGKELPESNEVFQAVAPDEPAAPYALVIVPAKMPKNSVVYFSVYTPQKGKGFRYPQAAKFLVSKDDPMNCRSV